MSKTRRWGITAAVGVIVLLGVTDMAMAAAQLMTKNDTDVPMWVTIYTSGKRSIVEAGCVDPKQQHRWTGREQYAYGSTYHIRAEATKTARCAPLPNNAHVICDTSIETKPRIDENPLRRWNPEVRLVRSGSHCHWEKLN